MLTSQKHVFWQALIVTVLLFGAGIFMGIILENWRVNRVDYLYRQSEILLLDLRAHGEIAGSTYIDCETSIAQNLVFADRVFSEAETLAKYEGAERLSGELELEHKKYDVLRALLWSRSIELRKKCKADFHNVVYIYDYDEPTLEIVAKQGVFSRILSELKEKRGGDIVLIPMAGDNNLSSVSLMMELYNVSEEELPVILIDEGVKITELQSSEEIEEFL